MSDEGFERWAQRRLESTHAPPPRTSSAPKYRPGTRNDEARLADAARRDEPRAVPAATLQHRLRVAGMCSVPAASDHRRQMFGRTSRPLAALTQTVETSEARAMPTAVDRRHGAAFWTVAFAFLFVMAFATLPSPLYSLYRTRDDLSTLTVTVVYAVFACGAIVALLCEPHRRPGSRPARRWRSPVDEPALTAVRLSTPSRVLFRPAAR